jgi:hypothetical protein
MLFQFIVLVFLSKKDTTASIKLLSVKRYIVLSNWPTHVITTSIVFVANKIVNGTVELDNL